ncbi:MAG: HAD family hydrolase [Candidatus Omnitrophica bacterium]|nr:HAD family hydrolase [Candidatus Omnitrophota bacterium]
MEKVIFVDRDGVINKDPGGWTKYDYVTRWSEFLFIEGSIDALKVLKEAGYKVYIISNQAGIAKGYFTQEDLEKVNKEMLRQIENGGGKIEGLFYCPHSKADECDCRKPKTGLIEKALAGREVDRKKTFVIGDDLRDIEAGKKMGMRTILVLSGKTSLEACEASSVRPDYIKNNLLEAVLFVLQNERGGNG